MRIVVTIFVRITKQQCMQSGNNNVSTDSIMFSANEQSTSKEWHAVLSPAYILTISPRFTVAPCVFTQRLRKTIRRGEIVSMYAGL